jgi:hypothetical protein
LFYYVYKSGNYFIKEKGDLWEGLKKTVGELRQLLPVIQAPEARLDFKTDSDKTDASGIPAVHAIIKELRPGTVPDGGTVSPLQPGFYLISVNTLNEPVTATFDFKRPPSAAAFDFFSGAGFPLSDSRLILEFEPLERKVLYFHPAL